MNRLIVLLVFILSFLAIETFGCGKPGGPTNDCHRPEASHSPEAREELGARLGLSDRQLKTSNAYAQNMRREILNGNSLSLARRTDKTLDYLIARAAAELRKRGATELAYFKESEWKREYSGTLTRWIENRDIGDHPTELLSVWLENFYDTLELTLGIAFCRMSHLSDIKSINATVRIVLKPCTFPMNSVTGSREDEYRRHFAEGSLYYGLVPVLVFWATEIGVSASGGLAVAGLLATGAEYIMGKWIAPRLSDIVFSRACN